MHGDNPIRGRRGHRGWALGAAALLLAAPLGCADGVGSGADDGSNRVFFVEPGIFGKFLALIGTTAGLVGRHAALPGQIDLEAATVGCPQSDPATVAVDRSCTHPAPGETDCTQTETYDACQLVDGTITAPFTVINGSGMDMTLEFDGYVQGNLDLNTTEVAYDGTIELSTGTDRVTFSEDQAIVATEPATAADDGPSETPINQATSSFAVAIEADHLLFDGDVTYAVGGIGTVNASLKGLRFPLDPAECAGPTAGVVRVEVGLLRETAEGTYDGCNNLTLVNLEQGEPVKTTLVDAAAAASLFAASITDIRTFAAAPVNAQPVADAPFAGELTAGAAGELWCRIGGADVGTDPFVTAVSTAAGGAFFANANAVGECLRFVPATTSTEAGDAGRNLLTALFSFEGPLTDAEQAVLAGANWAGAPVPTAQPGYDADAGTLALNTGAEADIVATPNRAALENQLALAAAGQGPHPMTAGTAGGGTPVWRCIDEANSAAGCSPDDTAYAVDFSRLGMWLTSGGTAKLFTRIVADQ